MVELFSEVLFRHPQTAYAGLKKSLQKEWYFFQRVTPDIGESFLPVEKDMEKSFLPALFRG